MSAPVIPSVGTTPVQALYDLTCFVMLEDGGLRLQATPQQFLDQLAAVYLDWLQKTELVQTVQTQMASFAISQYPVPDEIIRPTQVLYDGILLERQDRQSLDNGRGQWQRRMGEPQAWHEDGLPIKTIEIVDAPQFQGTNMAPAFGDFFAGQGNLSIVGPTRPTSITLALDTVLDLIPDSFAAYLAYGVLHRFFSMDGDLKDEARAQYCRARYDEGIFLAQAISGNDLQEGENE